MRSQVKSKTLSQDASRLSFLGLAQTPSTHRPCHVTHSISSPTNTPPPPSHTPEPPPTPQMVVSKPRQKKKAVSKLPKQCAKRKKTTLAETISLIFATVVDPHPEIENLVLRGAQVMLDQFYAAIEEAPRRGGTKGKGSRPGAQGVAKTGQGAKGVARTGQAAKGVAKTGPCAKGVAKKGRNTWGQPELIEEIRQLSGVTCTCTAVERRGRSPRAVYRYKGMVIASLKSFIKKNKRVWKTNGKVIFR